MRGTGQWGERRRRGEGECEADKKKSSETDFSGLKSSIFLKVPGSRQESFLRR